MNFVLVFSLAARVQGDSWFGPDKVKHFVLAAFVQSASYSAIRTTGAGHRISLGGATAATVAISVGKEVADRRRTGLFSRRDLVWDAAGAGTAAVLLSQTPR